MSSAKISVRVTTRASTSCIDGWSGDELRVRVTSAPVDGKANAAVCAVIADALKVPKSSVHVLRGSTSRHKIVEVDGVDDARVRSALK